MSSLIVHKVVGSLPSVLTASTLYFVRTGAGFDLYLTNEIGTVVTYQINGSSSSGSLKGQATITMPVGRAYELTQSFAAIGVTPLSIINLSLASHSDIDENHETMLDLSAMAGKPLVDEIEVSIAFNEPTSGPVKLNWSAL